MIFDELEAIPSFFKNVKRSLESIRPDKDLLVFEVPGFTKEDLTITIDGYVMRIQGKKEIYGKNFELDHKMIIPTGLLDQDNPITAKVENGILCINLKKNEKPKQTKVEIS
jgi:HSP20 family molecular chaperone IbpA